VSIAEIDQERLFEIAPRSEQLPVRVVDGEVVVYDPKRERMHVLNATAAYLWQSCDGSHTVSQIISLLTERYPDSRFEIEMDVTQAVRQLIDEGLLRA
jgi:hypothetical protein